MRTRSGRSKVLTLFLVLTMLLSSFPLTTVLALPAPGGAASGASSSPAVAPAPVPPSRRPSLAVRARALPEEARPGETVTLTVRLANVGEAPAHGVVLTGGRCRWGWTARGAGASTTRLPAGCGGRCPSWRPARP